VANALAPYGLAISAGDTTSVGVGGLILGGGIGWMVRKDGLALDNVVAAEVVTADGRVVRASADEHADLFWAIRGGGGNFGVVTTFDLTARPVREVLFGTISYPAAQTATALRGWRDYLRTAPDEVTTTARIFPNFGGEQPPFTITVCYSGADLDAGRAALEPLFHLGTLIGNEVKAMPYADVLEDANALPPGLVPMVKNRFARVCGDDLLDTAMNPDRPGMMFVEFRGLGGAMARVAPDATAFAYRDVEVMVLTALLDPSPDAAAKFATFWESLAPFTAGAYGNFLTTANADDVASIYPPQTYARLAAIKHMYDPQNVFNHNHNIPPAAVG
ncbi:MAG TPA: FAD-binding protein, partial [Micromonosporaceae bacterium]|nr:FAD-binding protein [Micromonosporaceae bacterium]